MSGVILSAKGLCKSFASDGEQNHVLSDVNIEIYEKDFTVVMGASGSGKSTLLYCLSGMETVTSGKVVYKGNAISDYKENQLVTLRRGDFGFIFQQIHLVSNLTLLENIAVPGYLNKSASASQVNERANALITSFGLTDAKNRLPSQTSGGEQQRAAIARALISNPKLLFADEPTGALNRKNGIDVLDLLTKLNEDGQSILMVTHDMRAAIRANRLIYISDGKIIDEMSLPPYSANKIKSREIQVTSWLSSMSW